MLVSCTHCVAVQKDENVGEMLDRSGREAGGHSKTGNIVPGTGQVLTWTGGRGDDKFYTS